ncbi:hypothetical protein GUJ93_ZPchr0013g34661 [Zizania palustris]|uniref:Uncharacterized protein n=1 Tax=Zizania palustris TaxID=103762 RepID=A0A8J5WWG7_ZIZPA|nr:hypothetical protein GUJ93_ZPchr0013g34661 [Zizania palustris]
MTAAASAWHRRPLLRPPPPLSTDGCHFAPTAATFVRRFYPPLLPDSRYLRMCPPLPSPPPTSPSWLRCALLSLITRVFFNLQMVTTPYRLGIYPILLFHT